jgi:hypothetical protein
MAHWGAQKLKRTAERQGAGAIPLFRWQNFARFARYCGGNVRKRELLDFEAKTGRFN